MMQAIVLEQFGDVEHLRMGEWPMPEPKAGEVRIRIRAISVNPVDTKMRQGHMGADLPIVLGRDVAGVVDAVGPDAGDLREGDEVFAVLSGPRSNGAYAQYVTTHHAFVARRPQGVSELQAAALGVAGLTAYETVVRKARVQRGEAVLVAGASGGVGSMALPLLRMAGAAPILCTAGSDESADYLVRSLGVNAAHVLRYRDTPPEQLAQQVRDLAGGRGVAAAFDYVGGDMKKLCFGALDFDGRVLSIVEEYDPAFELDLWRPAVSPLWARSGTFHYVALSARARFGGPEAWGVYREALAALVGLVNDGKVPPPQLTDLGTLSTETIREAHRRLQTGHTRGKLVLRVE